MIYANTVINKISVLCKNLNLNVDTLHEASASSTSENKYMGMKNASAALQKTLWCLMNIHYSEIYI